jgi:hypothetical protein
MDARSTEPMLFNGMKYVLSKLPHPTSPVRRGEDNVKELQQELKE